MRLTSSRVTRLDPPRGPRPLVSLELATADGPTGSGDAAPLPPFSREDAAACAGALTGIHARLGPIDEGAPPPEAIAAALRPLGRDLDAVPSARLALETALFDLIGAINGRSIAECLGGSLAYDHVPTNALLLAAPVETLADRAVAAASRGFSAIKIKLRAPDDAGFARELVALREVRDRLPLPFELRLDPNAAWTLDEARARLEALAPIAPRFVEQPVAPADLPRLGPCAVPWAADESLADPDLARRLLTARGCAAFVLKPAILGGLLRARDLALRAQAAGLDVVITHLFDGPHALAAACELALSLPRPPLACGLDRHDALEAWSAAWGGLDLPQLARPGLIRSSGAAGLGITSHFVCGGHDA